MGQLLLDGSLKFLRRETKRTPPARVGDLSIASNQIQTVGPTRVSRSDFVVNAIDDGGDHVQAEVFHAGGCHFEALTIGNGIFHDGAVEIGASTVNRVRFFDVNEKELDFATVCLVELAKPTGFVAKRRSGVASEDQCHRLLVRKAGELHRFLRVVDLGQIEVWRHLAHNNARTTSAVASGAAILSTARRGSS